MLPDFSHFVACCFSSWTTCAARLDPPSSSLAERRGGCMWRPRCSPLNSAPSDLIWHTHSVATQIWTGFSLHTNLYGCVTGQMLLSPLAPSWHTHTQAHAHKDTNKLPTQHAHGAKWPIHSECKDDSPLGVGHFPLWTHVLFLHVSDTPLLSLLLLGSLLGRRF